MIARTITKFTLIDQETTTDLHLHLVGKNDETALHDDTDSHLHQDAADTTGWSFCWTVSVHDIYLLRIRGCTTSPRIVGSLLASVIEGSRPPTATPVILIALIVENRRQVHFSSCVDDRRNGQHFLRWHLATGSRDGSLPLHDNLARHRSIKWRNLPGRMS
jgi:hypothetical protein